ncbi:MAG: sialate O-acetylesterase, partial [Verrucomicrobia bacterium]|nr:sialate O-acetylesterase [Verrucomicrobiota bacterium]
MNVKKNLVCAICALALAVCALPAGAELRLPPMFADHMVLQRDVAVPVWGWAEPGEEVTVEFAGQKKTTKADAKGQWTVKLDPMPLSAEPRALRVFSTLNPQPLTISDILVGEVWLGSGQSNMAMSVERSKDFDKEKAASNLPQVRMFTVTSAAAATAQDNCTGSWAVCAPDTVGKFSATL